MYPIGTRVIVRSVDHLGHFRNIRPPKRLLGRTGTITAHLADGMHEVAGLSRIAPNGIRWVFATEHLDPAA